MSTLKKYLGLILWSSLFSAIVALDIGAHIGYQAGLRVYDDLLFDEALADIYYADNPVDCPPCHDGKTYEWFYVAPPADIHLLAEKESPLANEEGGNVMDP